MKNILIVGSGQLGLRLGPILRKKIPIVYGTIRNTSDPSSLRKAGITPISIDLDDPNSFTKIGNLSNNVIFLAPPTPNSPKDLRVKRFLNAWSKNPTSAYKSIIYASTTSVYGENQHKIVTEISPIKTKQETGLARISAENSLKIWNKSYPYHKIIILRISGIYGNNRPIPGLQYLDKNIPLLCKEEDLLVNRIHENDLISIICRAIYLGKASRIYNCSDQQPLYFSQTIERLAHHLKRDLPPKTMTRSLLHELYPNMKRFLNGSKYVSNSRLSELGVKLQFPSLYKTIKQVIY